MIVLINIGRIAMIAWALYCLVLIFAPALVHQPPSQASGIMQFVLAYGVGYLLDRFLGAIQRRKADLAAINSPIVGAETK